MPNRFRSLRFRLLLPILAVALLASVVVAVVSYLLGDRWAREDLNSRYAGIETILSDAAFPLNRPVVASIAELTETEIVTLSSRGGMVQSSIQVSDDSIFRDLGSASENRQPNLLSIGEQDFRVFLFDRQTQSNDDASRVAVLFNEAGLRASRFRATILPLATGLSTILLLTSVTLLLASRLIQRLSRLQQHVNQIADGDFESEFRDSHDGGDEVSRLGAAVTQMSGQLQKMWKTLQRQQGQKLLHQIAGGLAHQLRNSITGARMAVELHDRDCQATDDSLSVALSQLEQTEQHLKRLLLAAAGKQDADHPQTVGECLLDIQTAVTTTANHLGVTLTWHIDDTCQPRVIADGPSFTSAITNLVFNAIQEGRNVDVHLSAKSTEELVVEVIDDGAGPAPEVANEIFEPFVTSKPEGLGLGLPLVATSARRLGGDVKWSRKKRLTHFVVTVRCVTQ
ncbi:MAG: ATP-binding protein [Rubripirellula sp.]